MNAPAAKLAQEDVAFQRGLYEDGNATRRSLHQYRRDWVLDQVARFSKSGDAVLEVGVGCGVFTEALSQTGRKVSAVDINPAFLENVRLLDAVETHLLDATNPLGLGQHDLAICSEVLEHVPSERSEMLLSAVAGSLRPGGTFILTTPQRYATVELMAGLFRFKPVLALARMVYGPADRGRAWWADPPRRVRRGRYQPLWLLPSGDRRVRRQRRRRDAQIARSHPGQGAVRSRPAVDPGVGAAQTGSQPAGLIR
jgi:SAM-dependent methyltransferase